MNKGWYAVDFDNTICDNDGLPIGRHPDFPDEPVALDYVKALVAAGEEVRILTARVNSNQRPIEIQEQKRYIRNWTLFHIGTALEATSEKDYDMIILFDDRAIAVSHSDGRILGGNVPSWIFLEG